MNTFVWFVVGILTAMYLIIAYGQGGSDMLVAYLVGLSLGISIKS